MTTFHFSLGKFLSANTQAHIFCCKSAHAGWAWLCTPVIPALGRLRQEEVEFEARLDYLRACLKKHILSSPSGVLEPQPWDHLGIHRARLSVY
jgi:hypothetical protein